MDFVDSIEIDENNNAEFSEIQEQIDDVEMEIENLEDERNEISTMFDK